MTVPLVKNLMHMTVFMAIMMFMFVMVIMSVMVIMVDMANFCCFWWWNTNFSWSQNFLFLAHFVWNFATYFFHDGVAMLVLNVLTMFIRYFLAFLLRIGNAFFFLFENTIFYWLFLTFFFFHAMCLRNFFANWFIDSDAILLGK